MLFLWLSAAVLSMASILAFIPSKFEDIHRRSVHHTCESNDECQARLKSSWPLYTFVCCTTIICDENYGNYYLVSSGCTPQQQCTPVIETKGYSYFAERKFLQRNFE
uniref:Uncharacterized protein n=1 Tax=Parascaris univalens TaxID=6257 RepID=A0A915CG27_PARUN